MSADLAARLLAAIDEREARFMVPLGILRQDLIGQAAARIAAFTNPEHARTIAAQIADRVLPADATHIVEDRAAVLRHCAADRRTLERHGRQVVVTWPVDRARCTWCDRDDRPVRWPCPDVRDLAEGYGIEVFDG